MTPADLQNNLIDRLRVLFENFPLQTEYNKGKKPFTIYKQNTPEQMSDEMDYSEEGDADTKIYPFICVQLLGGEKEDNHTTQEEPILIMIATHNENLNREGFDDAVAAAQLIMNDINANPILDGRYVAKYPLRWKPHEEDLFPFFFVGIEVKYELLTVTNHGGMHNDDW